MDINQTGGRRGQRRQTAGVLGKKYVFFDVKGGENVLHAYVHVLIYLSVCVRVCV